MIYVLMRKRVSSLMSTVIRIKRSYRRIFSIKLQHQKLIRRHSGVDQCQTIYFPYNLCSQFSIFTCIYTNDILFSSPLLPASPLPLNLLHYPPPNNNCPLIENTKNSKSSLVIAAKIVPWATNSTANRSKAKHPISRNKAMQRKGQPKLQLAEK